MTQNIVLETQWSVSTVLTKTIIKTMNYKGHFIYLACNKSHIGSFDKLRMNQLCRAVLKRYLQLLKSYLYYFMCVHVLPMRMYAHYMCAWCPYMSEEFTEVSETRLKDGCE